MTPADLADARCPDCGHPRTGCGCSCTGPGTCGGGTDDVEADERERCPRCRAINWAVIGEDRMECVSCGFRERA